MLGSSIMYCSSCNVPIGTTAQTENNKIEKCLQKIDNYHGTAELWRICEEEAGRGTRTGIHQGKASSFI